MPFPKWYNTYGPHLTLILSLFFRRVSFGREKIVEILLQNSANPNSRTNSQETPLHKAVEYGHLKVVEVLLNHGADRTLKNNRNRTPWQGAQYYKRGNYQAVIALLEEHK